MKIILPLLVSVGILSGCAGLNSSTKREQPVVEYRSAQKQAPAELYEIPPYPKLEFTPETKQSDIANWILDIEAYIQTLEGKIGALKEFFEPEVE